MAPSDQAQRVFDHYCLRLGVERPPVTAFYFEKHQIDVFDWHRAPVI
jgi:hypothetical protein